MTNKPWKVILLLAAIFLAGGVTGVMVGQRKPRMLPPALPAPEKWADLHLKRSMGRLALSPAQLTEIEPIVRQRIKELSELRAKYLSDSKTLRNQMEGDIAAKLNAEQRVLYEEHNRTFRDKMRRFEGGGRPPAK